MKIIRLIIEIPTVVIFFALLELNRNTLAGWLLTAALTALYISFRFAVFPRVPLRTKSVLTAAVIAAAAAVFLLTAPPVRAVRATETAGNSGKIAAVTPIYTVAQGELTGVYTPDGEVEVFAGVPYAEPPVGDLRWREPVPASGWDGVLAADHFAPMAMQPRNSAIYSSLAQIIGYHDYKITLADNYSEPVSEDALYLNIWKPAGDVSGLPVLVYIHGGSLQTGQPWYEDYRGASLAREGVVAVNMGYRLGVFGFLADEELAAESPNGTTGNYGLLDQIEALKWVRDNIAAFGGDPDNVTIAGESAGAACVSALCTSPLAEGLFVRAIAESSAVCSFDPPHSFRLFDEALSSGAELKARYGASSIEELRSLPAEKLVGEAETQHHITVDGYVLTELPYESYRRGVHNEKALLHGYNSEESAPFILFSHAKLTDYEQRVRKYFEESADDVLALYSPATNEEADRYWADIYGSVFFGYSHYCWTRLAAANGIPVYEYYFTKENGRLGPWHSGEMIYCYGNIPEKSKLFTDADRNLSRVMLSYWANFAKTGDPNGISGSGNTGAGSGDASVSTFAAGADASVGTFAADLVPGTPLPYFPECSDAETLMEFGDHVGPVKEEHLPLFAVFDRHYGGEY